MIKIAQFASYDTNVGDSIAIRNIRRRINKLSRNEIRWSSCDLNVGHKKRNNIEFCKEAFKRLSDDSDMLIIGGGGLIEAEPRMDTGWKLPFNEEILDVIEIPIVCFSVGINYFRGFRELKTEKELGLLKTLVDRSALFSVRNDGSKEIIDDIMLSQGIVVEDKIREIPDPGLIHDFESDVRHVISDGVFQPVWNNKETIMSGRKMTGENLLRIRHVADLFDMDIMPHTKKDFSFYPTANTDRYSVAVGKFKERAEYSQFMSFIHKYFNYDYTVSMRGHGQLISIGLNIPSIYFSTQDKLLRFSQKNGFEDYNIDIEEEEWDKKLIEKIILLKEGGPYKERWHEIRNEKMKLFKSQYDMFCLDTLALIK